MGKKEINDGVRILPGMDGRRFRLKAGENIPQLKKDDPVQPTPVADAKVRIFDLSDDEDLQAYAKVWDDASKGDVMISAEERHWCEDTQNFKIFLRWGEVFLEIPRTYGRMVHDGTIYE